MTDDKSAAKSVWGASPAGTTFGAGAAPGTREFFAAVLEKRSKYEMPWLFELVPFSTFRGRDVLEIGCGAGYDAYELCRSGARYVGIDLVAENPMRVRNHLEHYGFEPSVVQADAEDLPFRNGQFDVAFSNGVLHHTPGIRRTFTEAYRVLKPQGEFWVVLYHRDSLFYWLTLGLVEHVLRGGFRTQSFKERLGRIEFTTSSEVPLVNVYTRRSLRRLLVDTGFEVEAVHVRKLLREDLPNVRFMRAVKRRLPQTWLDRVGRHLGWYLIARARKPESGNA